jgi:hypothetical protein
MDHAVSGYTARFTIWSHRYIQTRQINQDMENFMFAILLKQHKTVWKPIKPRAYGRNNAMIERDAATS